MNSVIFRCIKATGLPAWGIKQMLEILSAPVIELAVTLGMLSFQSELFNSPWF